MISRAIFCAGKLMFIFMFGVYRAAEAAGDDESGFQRVRSPTGDFGLGPKVTKRPPRGYPLATPFTGAGNRLVFLFSALSYRNDESFAPLTRSCGAK